MKYALIFIAIVGFSIFEYSCNAKPENAAKGELRTNQEKYSYMIGLDMGRTLKNLNVEIDRDALVLGVEASLLGRPPLLADSQIVKVRNELIKELKKKRQGLVIGSGEKSIEDAKALLDASRK